MLLYSYQLEITSHVHLDLQYEITVRSICQTQVKIVPPFLSNFLQCYKFKLAETISQNLQNRQVYPFYQTECVGCVKIHGLGFFSRANQCCIQKNTGQYEMVLGSMHSGSSLSGTRAVSHQTSTVTRFQSASSGGCLSSP